VRKRAFLGNVFTTTTTVTGHGGDSAAMMGTFIAMVLRRLVDTFLRRSPSTTASAAVVAQAAAESAAWCRGMDGRPLPAARNPGLSVKPSFVSAAEEQQLVACALELKQGYGFTSSEAQDVLAVGGGATAASSSSNGSGSGSDGLQVQAERVTGRPELPTQVHAPWGYGDAFDMAKVPAPLQAIASRIRDDDMLGRPTQVLHPPHIFGMFVPHLTTLML